MANGSLDPGEFSTPPFYVLALVSKMGLVDLFPGLVVPMTPITPISPTGSGFPTSLPPSDAKPKKSNPLVDLIETEKTYVDLLTGIIRVGFLVSFPTLLASHLL